MKYLLAASMLCFCVICHAQSTDEQAIRAVMNQQVTAWNNGDIESFMQTYLKSDSIMFIGHNGITYGWDSTLAHYKRGYPDRATMGKLTFELKELKPLCGNYYFVVGKFMLEREKGNASGHFDLLFKKVAGKWYIVSDHTS
ncbi:nuclear transport factor 2 family protein [Ilyomonas limi]|uniref:Nuclear transport factor 2 family protein n=1 Tax=Ilyomonas limi TaxID=2575867 RepID=A0A4U3KZ07_9BACT|nr:nuclear transport factor 2 family protein [Ilyomonas limi]TKK67652.1 nuclear transport factor 2 family protein [Ilyomonas limi]